jgi:hypothetical protein
MTTQSMTLAVQRRSPIHIPRRDLVLSGADTLRLTVHLRESDTPGAAPVGMVGLGPRLRLALGTMGPIWSWDYGYTPSPALTYRSLLWAGFGVASLTEDGRVDIDVPRGALGDACGRLWWMLQLDYGRSLTLLAHGVAQVLPAPPLGDDLTPLLADDRTPILAAPNTPIEV